MTKLLLVLSLFSVAASADTRVVCNFSYMTVPMATVTMTLAENGTPNSKATINMQGATHQESVTPDVLTSDEFIHIWLSKENPDNAIEMIVFRHPTSQGQAELINHNVPFAQDMWGGCAMSAMRPRRG